MSYSVMLENGTEKQFVVMAAGGIVMWPLGILSITCNNNPIRIPKPISRKISKTTKIGSAC